MKPSRPAIFFLEFSKKLCFNLFRLIAKMSHRWGWRKRCEYWQRTHLYTVKKAERAGLCTLVCVSVFSLSCGCASLLPVAYPPAMPCSADCFQMCGEMGVAHSRVWSSMLEGHSCYLTVWDFHICGNSHWHMQFPRNAWPDASYLIDRHCVLPNGW